MGVRAGVFVVVERAKVPPGRKPDSWSSKTGRVTLATGPNLHSSAGPRPAPRRAHPQGRGTPPQVTGFQTHSDQSRSRHEGPPRRRRLRRWPDVMARRCRSYILRWHRRGILRRLLVVPAGGWASSGEGVLMCRTDLSRSSGDPEASELSRATPSAGGRAMGTPTRRSASGRMDEQAGPWHRRDQEPNRSAPAR